MSDLPSLRQLDYFLALVETGHFRRAAERCGISQPSLSVQLANLEKILGLVLVERARSGVVVTPAGREVAARARRILDETRAILDLSETMRTGLAGTLRLGASATLGPYLLPHVVAVLHKRYRDLNLYIREGPPAVLLDDLSRGEHDMVLVQLPAVGGDFAVTRLFREPLDLAIAHDHRFAGRDRIERPELAGEIVLTLGPAYALHAQVLELCDVVGANLHRDYQGTSLDALRLMAGMGMGVALLPALYIRTEIGPQDPDVRVVRVERPRPTRSIGLVRRASHPIGDAAARMAEIIRQVVRDRFSDILTLEG